MKNLLISPKTLVSEIPNEALQRICKKLDLTSIIEFVEFFRYRTEHDEQKLSEEDYIEAQEILGTRVSIKFKELHDDTPLDVLSIKSGILPLIRSLQLNTVSEFMSVSITKLSTMRGVGKGKIQLWQSTLDSRQMLCELRYLGVNLKNNELSGNSNTPIDFISIINSPFIDLPIPQPPSILQFLLKELEVETVGDILSLDQKLLAKQKGVGAKKIRELEDYCQFLQRTCGLNIDLVREHLHLKSLKQINVPNKLHELFQSLEITTIEDLLNIGKIKKELLQLPKVGATKAEMFFQFQTKCQIRYGGMNQQTYTFSEELLNRSISDINFPSKFRSLVEIIQAETIRDLWEFTESPPQPLPRGVGRVKVKKLKKWLIEEDTLQKQKPNISTFEQLWQLIQTRVLAEDIERLDDYFVKGMSLEEIGQHSTPIVTKEGIRRQLKISNNKINSDFHDEITRLLSNLICDLETKQFVFEKEYLNEKLICLRCIDFSVFKLSETLLSRLSKVALNSKGQQLERLVLQFIGYRTNLIVGHTGMSFSDILTDESYETLKQRYGSQQHADRIIKLRKDFPELTPHVLRFFFTSFLKNEIDFLSTDVVRHSSYEENVKDKLDQFLRKISSGVNQEQIRENVVALKDVAKPSIANMLASIPEAISIDNGVYSHLSNIAIPTSTIQHIVTIWEKRFHGRADLIDGTELLDLITHFDIPKEYNNPYFTVSIATQSSLFHRVGAKKVRTQYFDEKQASLAILYPHIAAEWHPTKNNKLSPEDVRPTSLREVYWLCKKGHEFKCSLVLRTANDSSCPACLKRWMPSKIKHFITSLAPHLPHLSPPELYTIFQQSGLLSMQTNSSSKEHRELVKQIKSGRLPLEQVKRLLEVDTDTRSPDSDDSSDNQDTSVLDIQEEISERLSELELSNEVQEEALPVIRTKDALAAMEFQTIATSDDEAVDFLIASAKAKLWKHAYEDVEEAKTQAEQYQGGEYATTVKDTFLKELNKAQQLQIPDGYSFTVDGFIDTNLGYTPPLLMQRLCAVRIRDNKRYGNWSGTGAGKTLSAILSTRVVDSRLTIVCCPNAVVNNWRKEIIRVFPDSDIQFKTWEPQWQANSTHRYLIQNFENFQQTNSEAYIKHFIDREGIEFVVIDEIHYSKQRYREKSNSEKGSISKRKKLVQGLIARAGELNPSLYVLGMSATPVINNLYEGISLLEMMMGHKYSDLNERATVNNCMRLYQQLVTNGTRWKPDYSKTMDLKLQLIDVDCGEYVQEIRGLGEAPSTLSIEKVLTQARLPTILEHIHPNNKTLIYTHYVEEIDLKLFNAIRGKGFKVGFYTGKDKTGLDGFLHGDVDVLIGSSSIGTGVDGLQHVCNTLIINVLPWTNAEYEQLRGRIYRQGSNFEQIEIIIPVTHADINGERWSYCESKWRRICYKKSIADAAVDGIVPEGNLRSPAQAQKDLLQWLHRLDSGEVDTIHRAKIIVPLSGDFKDIERRKRRYGDFSRMNSRWNHSNSQTLANRLEINPEEWEQYHTLYQEARRTWTVIPFKEMTSWLMARKHKKYDVGDFGCGEALIAASVGEFHTVYSFDHIAINDTVIAGDMSNIDMSDRSIDVAIFSLSLMGANFTDYLREAWRLLRVDGVVHIWEASSRFEDAEDFAVQLRKIGFKPTWPEERGKFTYIAATKVLKQPDTTIRLSF